MKDENKTQILADIATLLSHTRAGKDIVSLEMKVTTYGEFVEIYYPGTMMIVDITGDSGASMARDILKYIN